MKEYLFNYYFKLGDIEMCKRFYEKTFKISMYKNWYTVDHYKIMVQFGVDITAQNNFALRWSSENGKLEVVKYLVECGADITACDNYAVRSASIYGHQHVVDYIKSL